MFRLPRLITILFFQLVFIVLFIAWLVLFCIKPVVFTPDSTTYQSTAAHLTDPTSLRPILFPLLLRITNVLHLKQGIVCYLVDLFSLGCMLVFWSPRKKSLSRTNIAIMVGFLLLPAIWSYCNTCLTESILPAVEAWIMILMVRLFFPNSKTSLAQAILCSVGIALLATLLKPWIMLYILGCSGLLAMVCWR